MNPGYLIEVDDVVGLKGLILSQPLNGRTGVVISGRNNSGRYEVDIGERQIKVKEENLELLGKGIRGHADSA